MPMVHYVLLDCGVSYKNSHALAGTTKNETLAKFKEWS